MLTILLTGLLGYGLVMLLLSPIFWGIVAAVVVWESGALRVALFTIAVVLAVLLSR